MPKRKRASTTLVWCSVGQETKRQSHQSCGPLDDSNDLFVFCERCLHCLMTGLSLGFGPEAKHLKQWNNKICSDFLKDHGFYVGKPFQAIQ